MNRITMSLAILLVVPLIGCGGKPPADSELVLPVGNADLGKATFLEMRCYDCHRIPGVELPVAEETGQAVVVLGGDTSKVQSYPELVTSIINPSHKLASGYNEVLVARDGMSNMTNYNQVMTVEKLINLVAFLESHYNVAPER